MTRHDVTLRTGPVAAACRLGLARVAVLILLGFGPYLTVAQVSELRGWWVDTFHAGMRTAAEVDALLAEARAARFNALFVEVRKRGDAYYESQVEPVASDVAPGFDPLAYLVARAHDTNAGPYVEVHAWIVTYNIWNQPSAQPAQPDHPYQLHPDWLTQSVAGEKWDGSNYAFDPGHPAVQEHTVKVVTDLVSRYDLDGLHLDYIRYAGRDWGYHPVSVTRFNQATGSAGRPVPDDSWWMQWRRDQVTHLVRRIYLTATALKPQIRISAATITWTPSASSFPTWLKSAAWSNVLQDWRGWMEEGLLDLNVPMAYFRHETHAAAWTDWSRFAKENHFDRHVAIGVGSYLNSLSNSIVQMRSTRVQASATGRRAGGLLAYSYAAPTKEGTRTDFVEALTTTTGHDPAATPLFALSASSPPIPWKTNGTLRGITGIVRDGVTGQPIEGAQVELACAGAGMLTTDANGWFGTLLRYPMRLVVSASGYATRTLPWPDGNPLVAQMTISLEPEEDGFALRDLRVSVGESSALLSWRTAEAARARVFWGLGLPCGSQRGEVGETVDRTDHFVLLGGLKPGAAQHASEYWFRIETVADGRTNQSAAHRIVPGLFPAVADEWDVRLTGSWAFDWTGPGSPPAGQWRTSEASATATWSVPIEATGYYDLAYSLGPNTEAFAVTYEVRTPRTNFTVAVVHPVWGPDSRLLATNLYLARGEKATVRIRNQPPSAGAPLLVRSMTWRYRDAQEPPPPDRVPDWWARHCFGMDVEGTADADADGWSNYAEYVLGTDPGRSSSRLDLRLEPAPAGGWRAVFVPVVGGRLYALERTADLVTGSWERVTEPGPGESDRGEGVLADPQPTANPGFYRISVWLP